MHTRIVQVVLSAASLVGVAALIALAVWLTTDPEQARRGQRLAGQLEALENMNRELEEQVVRLKREIADLTANGEAIDRYARGSLGMVRPGERVYQFTPRMTARVGDDAGSR